VEADKGAECPLSRNNTHSTTRLYSTPTYSKGMQIGTSVFLEVLMSKMGICPKHAMPLGNVQIIKRDLKATMQVNTLQHGTMHALRQHTKVD
jgi:hypothetical protein